MTTPLFELRDIAFAYPGRPPLFTAVNAAILTGDRLALTGANGAGKSTLLQMLVGLRHPTQGTLTAFDRVRRVEADFQTVRRRAGLMFEDPDDQLFCATVAEDVAFGPLNLDWPPSRVAQAVTETLSLVGLAGYETRLTDRLSLGEKRLAALAGVLAMQPDVLLLDEPSDGLDQPHRDRLIDILTHLPATLVIASHDRPFLQRLTTAEWRLDQGRLHV